MRKGEKCNSIDNCWKFRDNYQYPRLQGIFWILDGQYDPAEQNISPLLKISAQTSAPPHVWFGFPGGNW
jgi:hypothetical protein